MLVAALAALGQEAPQFTPGTKAVVGQAIVLYPVAFRVARPEAIHRLGAGDSLKLASLRVPPGDLPAPWSPRRATRQSPARPRRGERGDLKPGAAGSVAGPRLFRQPEIYHLTEH